MHLKDCNIGHILLLILFRHLRTSISLDIGCEMWIDANYVFIADKILTNTLMTNPFVKYYIIIIIFIYKYLISIY